MAPLGTLLRVDSDETGAYPASWETDVVLSDGQTVHVRPIVPDDADRLVRFHSRQSPESIYFRYFSPRPELSPRDLHRFTHVDHHDRVAFVALAGDELIAVARYERYRGTDTAEVAFFIDDAHHGRGLATLLLEYLAAAGLERGVRRFAATTLPHNRKMLGVFAAAGYQVSSRIDDGVVEVAFDIDPTAASLAAVDRRERRAEAASVRHLLEPRSVAVVGVGRAGTGLGAEVHRNLVANGFQGPLYAVNLGGGSVDGVAMYRSVAELPGPVDLVVIATPANEVPGIVDECGEHGVGGVVVMSAGFSESGPEGAALEAASVEAARHHGIRLLGPNCLGVVNTDPDIRLDATIAPSVPPRGRTAMLAESGTLAAAIIEHAVRMDLGISTLVAAGNRADISVGDLLSYWCEDDATAGVLLYLAAHDLQPRFVRAARAASLELPVAALQTSMSARGSGDAAGDDRARAQAMFRQTGVIGVDTLEQLFDIGRLVADQPVPRGNGVVVLGNSDGAVALAADACLAAGLHLVPFEVDGVELPNPVDLTHHADAAAYRSAIEWVVADPRVHAVMVIHTPPHLELDDDFVDVVLDATTASPDITFAVTMLGAAGRGRLQRDGAALPIFRFPEDAARAIGRLSEYRAWRESVDAAGESEERVAEQTVARTVLDSLGELDDGPPVPLSIVQQSDLLAAYHVQVLERVEVDDVDAAVRAAASIDAPVVLKARRRDRLARSAASGVVLDLSGAEQVRSAWQRMHDAWGEGLTPAVVQRFVPHGIDVAVSVRRDPGGSGTVRVGLGGPASIARDYVLGVLPLTLSDASSLVASSPVGRVLTDPLDRVAVVELVHNLASLVVDHESIRSLRVDPVVCSPSDALVADVEVLVGRPPDDFDVRRLD